MPKIFNTIDKIKPAYDVAYNIVLFICKLLLVADILITTMAVAGRFIPFIPDPAWTEEVVLTCMAYMTVLSAALAIRKNSHIRMTAFDRYLPKHLLIGLDIIADVAVLGLALVMIVVGWKYAIQIGSVASYVSMPNLSKFWMYFPIPVAGIAMFIFEIDAIYNHIKLIFIKEEDINGCS
ncbi:TRAP transporter small permease [Clostridium sp.]|jgi:TRAP-type C4-dicarboxylate transport system permease small subunit|uniref:TRAP transporter small permease n=1 Tax=Clostridium sp. TaxID=1506 RepID=UPI003EE8DF2F